MSDVFDDIIKFLIKEFQEKLTYGWSVSTYCHINPRTINLYNRHNRYNISITLHQSDVEVVFDGYKEFERHIPWEGPNGFDYERVVKTCIGWIQEKEIDWLDRQRRIDLRILKEMNP
jgi:hypothetical protein